MTSLSPLTSKTGRIRTWLAVAGVVVMTVLAAAPGLGGVEIDIRSLIRNWSNGYNKLLQMLQPNFEFIPRTIGPMLEALQMAWVGAAISAIVSVRLRCGQRRPRTNQHLDELLSGPSLMLSAPYQIWSMPPFWWQWSAWAHYLV